MIEFKPITLDDKKTITSFTLSGERRDSNLSLANLCCWHFFTGSSYALIDGLLVIRFCHEDGQKAYTIPVADSRMSGVVRQLQEQAETEKQSLYLYGVFPEIKERLEIDFPGIFEYSLSRDHYDYIYRRQDLAELVGKNYQSKRNHVNKFIKLYPYEYLPLTPSLIPQCLEMYIRWCDAHNCDGDESLAHEREALTFALEHFLELDLMGGVIRVADEIVAFTYGSPVNQDTFDVLAEKANMDVDGAYNMINREFARHLPEQYIYLNREEDLGLEGLRKAKLSYRPAILLEKGVAIKRRRS